jgi:hypothetical protein
MYSLNALQLESNSKLKINFDGGDLSSDSGLLLIKEFAHKFGFHKQECEAFNYHYSAHGYHPLLCYDGLNGDLLKAELRNGTDYSSTGVVDFMQPLLDEYQEEYPDI